MDAVTFVNEVHQFGDRAEALRTVEAADGDLLFMYHETEFDEVLGRYVGSAVGHAQSTQNSLWHRDIEKLRGGSRPGVLC